MTQQEALKQEILAKTKEYYELAHKPSQAKEFIPGKSRVNYADKIMNDSFWIGLYPGMWDKAIIYMITKIREFIQR